MQRLTGRWALGACALATCFVTLSAQGADTLTRIRESGAIVIAHREASIPFSYLDANNKPIGYTIDLCRKIADAVRRELNLPRLDIRYLPVTPESRVPALTEGRADLECGSTSNTADRRQQVAFTIPHFVATSRMLVLSDSGIRDWSDLRNKQVVSTKGTTSVKLLGMRDHVRSLNLKLLEGRDHLDSFTMVEKGMAAAFPMDDVLLYGLRAGSRDPARFSIVGTPLSAEPYAIMMRKGDPAFKSLVDREMARIINDGEIYQLYERWFRKPIPPKGQNLDMPMGYILRGSFRFPTDKVAD